MKRTISALLMIAYAFSPLKSLAAPKYKSTEAYLASDDEGTVTISAAEYQMLKRQAKRRHRHHWTDYVPYGPGYRLRPPLPGEYPYPIIHPPLPSPILGGQALNILGGGKALPLIIAAGLVGGVVSLAVMDQRQEQERAEKHAEFVKQKEAMNAAIALAAKTPTHEITRAELAAEYEALHPELDKRRKFKPGN